MNELPASFLEKVQNRREELASREIEVEDIDAKTRQKENEYRNRVKQVEEWAKVLGPLATAKQITHDAVIYSEQKDFPVWSIVREHNDGTQSHVDLSRSPSYSPDPDIWIGVVMDKKGLLFYFRNTPDTRAISIDDITPINHEKIKYRGLENINDVDGHGQGIDGIEKSLADFAINNGLVTE